MFGPLVDPTGTVNMSALDSMFDHFDRDSSGAIDAGEMKALLTGAPLCPLLLHRASVCKSVHSSVTGGTCRYLTCI